MDSPPSEKFDWIDLRQELDSINPERASAKFARKFKENPFIPIGCGLTATALCCGLYYFRAGNSKKQQVMMRARVIAQGFTVCALVVGIGLQAMKT